MRTVSILRKVLMMETKKLEIYTIQMAQWRKAKALGIKFVDITAKSGLSVFAPEMSWVMEYKAGEMSEEEYIRLYHAKMLTSQDLHRRFWDNFLIYDKVALACYCPAGCFCHRHLLKEYIKDYIMNIHGNEVILAGEIQ